MDVKPGFKQSDAGVIPEDWDVVSAFDACSKIQDGTHFSPRIGGNDYLYITSKNIRFGYLDTSTASRIDTAQHRAIYRRCDVRKGDLLLTKDGENTGNATLNTLDEEFSLLSSVAFLRFHPRKYCAAYILQQVLTSQGQRQMQDAMAGNAITRLTLEKINKPRFPAPPTKAEQEAIAEALSDADALVESLEHLLAKKRQIKQGAMQELLTGTKRLPGFSGKWQERTFGELFDFHSMATNARCDLNPEGDTYYVHYGDIHTRFHSHLDFRRDHPPKIDRNRCQKATLLHNGDWIVVDASEDFDGIAKAVEVCGLGDGVTAIAGLHTFLLREKVAKFAPGFKGHLRNLGSLHEQLLRVATGMKVFGVSKTAMRDVVLPVPSPAEQAAIATILSDMDAEITALEARLAKARQLKQGMMQELLTGRIRLTPPVSTARPWPAKKEAGSVSTKSHNWQINEAVVISVLAKNFGSEKWPLGRKRYTKLSYLLHRHADKQAEGYLKKAAGPYNPAKKYKGPEKIALKKQYVRRHSRDQLSGFVAAERIGDAERYFSKWYGDQALAWLEQFCRKRNDDLELLTTVDMAIEDLRRDGNDVELEFVKRVIRDHPEWRAKLDRPTFSDANIVRGIEECRRLFPAEADG